MSNHEKITKKLNYINVPKWLITSREISPCEFRVLCCIMGDIQDGFTSPSSAISGSTNVSARQVKRCVKNLLAMGFLKVINRSQRHGNSYEVILDK